MTTSKLLAKLTAIAKLVEEARTAVSAIPGDVSVYRLEDMDTELAEAITCLRTVKRESLDAIEVYA